MQAYLDHAATTPMRGEAVAAMLPYLTEHYGNPSGSHAVARRARQALDEARDEVARCLGCEPGEVVFTSGGTEADNLALLGGHGTGRGTVLCSAIEHHAVCNACAAVGGTVVPVLGCGVIALDALAEALHPGVGLVSVMLVNNEVGTVQPLSEVAALVRALAPEALLHTDAVAAVGWLDTASLVSVADLVSVSAHNSGAPRGWARSSSATGPAWRPCCTEAPRSGTGVPAPTTSPGSSPWPRRFASPPATVSPRRRGSGACGIGSPRACPLRSKGWGRAPRPPESVKWTGRWV